MKNKIAGTGILKNKYKLRELSVGDIRKLLSMDITLYRCYHLKDDAYIYTTYKAVSNCLKNTYSKQKLWGLLPQDMIKDWFDGGHPFITTTEIISGLVQEFSREDLKICLKEKLDRLNAFKEAFLTTPNGEQ